MPQTQVDETQVNELDENPLEDLFNRPSDSPRMEMLGGSGILDPKECPQGQKWDKNTKTCIPLTEFEKINIDKPIITNTEVGEVELPEVSPTNPVGYAPDNPEESEFYRQSVDAVNSITQIQENPIMDTGDKITTPRIADLYGLGREGVTLINVDATTKAINEAADKAPDLLTSRDGYQITEIPGDDKIEDIRKRKELFEAETERMIRGVEDEDELYNIINRENTLVTAEEYAQLESWEDRQDYKEEGEDVVQIGGVFDTDGNIAVDISTLDNLDKYFEVDPEAYKYIKDTILTNEKFGDYATWEEFAVAGIEEVQGLIRKDPIIAKIFANSNTILANESKSKFVEILDKYEDQLTTPEGIEAAQNEYDTWQKNRWNELILTNENYNSRALQYEFAAHQVLKDLYIPFGRSPYKTKDGEVVRDNFLFDIDKDLAEGKISTNWWKAKETLYGAYIKAKKGIKGLGFSQDALKFQKYNERNVRLQKDLPTYRRLGLENKTGKELSVLIADDGYMNSLSTEDQEIVKYLNRAFNQHIVDAGADSVYLINRQMEKTVSEIIKEDAKIAKGMGLKVIEGVEENMKSAQVLSVLSEIDPDATDFFSDVRRVLDQSNMLIMGTGMALKTIPNPYAKGAGAVMDALASVDIISQTISGDLWATLDSKIKARKGEDYQPTKEDYLTELEDPESINMFNNILSTGAQFGMERLSLSTMLGLGQAGTKTIASLMRGQFKSFIYQLPGLALKRELAGFTEYITEGTQGLVSDANVRFQTDGNIMEAVSNAEFDLHGAKVGYRTGRFLFGAGVVVNQSAIELNSMALQMADMFNLTELAPTFANTERTFNEINDLIRRRIAKGQISKEEGNNQLNTISNYRNQGMKIPNTVDGRTRPRLLRLLLQQSKLAESIKKTDNKDLSGPELLELAEVSFEIKGIIDDAKNRDDYLKQVGNVAQIINTNTDANVKIIKSKNAKGVENQLEKLKQEGWKVAASKGMSTNYGTILQQGDQQVILLNENEILKDGAINTAAHEFLHAVLWQTVKNSKGTAINLGNKLVEYLAKANPELMKNSEFRTRLQQYIDDPQVTTEQQAEEVLTLFSEAILDGAISEAEFDGFWAPVSDMFRRVWQSLGFGNIRFDDGKDVYNFIKDFNRSIKKGKFTKAQQTVFSEGATGDLVKRKYIKKGPGTTSTIGARKGIKEPEKVIIKKSAKKLTELTKEYKDGNFDNVEDLTKQYQATGRDALKRWAGQRGVPINLGNPQVNEEVTSLLNKEFNSFTKNFDPSKAEASTYMENIAKRIGPKIVEEAARKGKQVSQDVLTEKGRELKAEETQETTDKEFEKRKYPTDIAAIEKQTADVRPEILKNIKNSVKQFIASSVGKVKEIGEKGKKIITKLNPSSLAKELKAQNRATRIAVRNAMGKSVKAQNDFIKKVINAGYIETIPIAAMKKRFKTVKGFNIEKIGRETLGAGTGIYKLSGLNKQALIDFYTKDQSGRRSFIDLLAKGLTIEQFQEVKIDPEFMNDLDFKLKEAKSELTAKEFMNEVERIYDGRTKEFASLDVVKASKKRQKSYQQTAYKTAARTPMSSIVDLISPSAKKVKWNDKDEKSYRKTRTMHYHYTMGSQMIKNYMYGSNTDIYGQKGAKLIEQELNEPLTKEEIEVLEEMGVPTVVRKGKTYYDQSKAPLNTVDETVTINGKEYSVLALSRKEQAGTITRNKKTTKISYANWSTKTRRQKLNNPEWREYQQAKLRVLKKIAKLIESDLKANPTNKNFWGTWLNGTQNNAIHPVRALAPIEFLHYRKLPNARMEHTLPANQVGTMIMRMALDGKVDEDFNFIEKDYFQGDISLFNDDLLKTMLDASGKKVNLKTDMPTLFFDIKNPTTWMRYVEKIVWASRTGGINMNEILVWDSKQNKIVTLTEQFGLPLTESEYKYKDGKNTNFGLIRYQNNLLYDVFRGKMTMPEAKTRLNVAVESGVKLAEQIQVEYNGKILAPGVLPTEATPEYAKGVMLNSSETKVNAFKASKKRKGISVFDFDDTIAKTKEQVLVKMPDGTLRRLTPAKFAEQADILTDQGAEFDFSQFENVIGAKKGPLADLALRRQDKFGSGDIYVLTARPQTSAVNIKLFLDSIGLNIPLENITGLEKGTPQAKVDWILNKTAEGYNDFYFADDSLANVKGVKNILEAIDVKNEVFQAKASKKRNLDTEFNKILEETTGLKADAKYSPVRAGLEGRKKDKGFFKWLGKQLTITPSAEDFMGLMYDIIGSGKQGNRHAKWVKDNLIDPYNKAEQQILSAKVTVANDFAALKKAFPSLRSSVKGNPLMDQIGVGPYTKSQAMRVYIWNKQGMEIPGISKRDQNALVKAVEADSELSVFADEVILIQKDKQYPAPTNNWAGGTIDSDIMSSIDKTFRRQVMTELDENVKIIFSEKNLNKLEALYGKKWVDALKDSLRRMKSGSNRPVYQGGGARIVNEMLDWLNGSVGAVMFLNVKSGLLQLISNVNFINWGDNNIYQAAKAFASKEYWPTVVKLMNSDYLVNRRDGLKINVNEAELANAAKDSGMKGAIAYLLDKGFIITRIMDSLAIATGGATFYINRRNALLERQNPDTGKKYTQAEAEAKAFDDFYAISEESQQSSNPSKISQQQASLAGRVLLAFQNVTMQYNRMTKKSIRDLYNRRKSPGMTQRESDLSNISKIIYYTTIQNVIFNALQQALFATLFDDEDDEKEKDRIAGIANGMADSLLFGLGFGGAAISTVKNVLLKIQYESQQKSPDYEEAVWEIFNVSPVLDSKVRKLRTTAKTFSWNREEIAKRGWSLDNPSYLAISQLISAATNIPIDRVLRKMMNMRMAMDEETRTWQRVALILGWTSWSVGLPYWGLQSTIVKEEEEEAKIKANYKADIRKMKAQGYKKVMYRNLEDFDPKNIIEMQSPAGTVVYYVKVRKGKQAKN